MLDQISVAVDSAFTQYTCFKKIFPIQTSHDTLPSQDIVTYTCSQKMEQLSLPPPSLSTSASQSSHEEVKSEYMKPEVVTSAKSSFD